MSRRSPADLWAFARAWTALLAADLALRTLPYPRVERLFAPASRETKGGEEEVARLAWATAAAARRHLYPMRCLPRALCLRWLLGRRGFAAELRIGVTREDGELLAHAWVEREGRPVGEEGVAERFAALGPTS
ncbi:MAG TPA: lasso peptide biosynthesis B2 protein [Thermoanaerobaculia bacterium]